MSTKVMSDLDFQGLAHLVRALLNPLTVDPGAPGTGEIWFRTDLKVIKVYDGTAVRTIANLDSVVNTLAAADSTVTVAGSAQARTVAVAKTLDSTYITNFDAQVNTHKVSDLAVPTATVNFNSQTLTAIADAVNPTDALNLRSAQQLLAQISDRAEVQYATSAALPANTYANGAAGSGATLTASANGVLTIDGANPAQNSRVLIQNEATSANNGIYVVTNTGSGAAAFVLTRASDFNTASNISTGVLIPVEAPSNASAGAANNAKVFISVAPSPVTVGTSSLTFTLIGSTYTAGTGLSLTGTTFSLTVPVSVANGGTGATTAANARGTSALGAPATAPTGAGSGGVSSIAAQGLVTKVLAVIGDGVTTTFNISHNLNTFAISSMVGPHNGGGTEYLIDSQVVDANTLRVVFLSPPASASVDVVIIG